MQSAALKKMPDCTPVDMGARHDLLFGRFAAIWQMDRVLVDQKGTAFVRLWVETTRRNIRNLTFRSNMKIEKVFSAADAARNKEFMIVLSPPAEGLPEVPYIEPVIPDAKPQSGDAGLEKHIYRFYFPLSFPLSPAEPSRQKRTMGFVDNEYFYIRGYRDAVMLARIFEHLGHGKDSRILDFGCGAGRIIFPLMELGYANCSGCDIDGDNIAWLQAKPGMADRFHVSGLQPPLPFPDASFDCIYAGSVFTHLDEATQFAFLEDLNRVLAPGGIMAVSVSSWGVLAWIDKTPAFIVHDVENKGINYDSQDLDLTDYGISGEYYRSTFHDHGYIRKTWGRYFDILHIYPYSFGYQDLVILKKKP